MALSRSTNASIWAARSGSTEGAVRLTGGLAAVVVVGLAVAVVGRGGVAVAAAVSGRAPAAPGMVGGTTAATDVDGVLSGVNS